MLQQAFDISYREKLALNLLASPFLFSLAFDTGRKLRCIERRNHIVFFFLLIRIGVVSKTVFV